MPSSDCDEDVFQFKIKAYDGTLITFTFINTSSGSTRETGNWELANVSPDVDLIHYGAGNVWGSNMEIQYRYKGVLHRGYIKFDTVGCNKDTPYDPTTTTTTSTTTSNPNTTTTTTTTTNTTTPAPPQSCIDAGGTWVAFYVDITWGDNIINSGIDAWIEWYDPALMTTERHTFADPSTGAGNWLFAECVPIPAGATSINYSVDCYFDGRFGAFEQFNGQEGGGSGLGVPSGQYEACAEFTDEGGGYDINACGPGI